MLGDTIASGIEIDSPGSPFSPIIPLGPTAPVKGIKFKVIKKFRSQPNESAIRVSDLYKHLVWEIRWWTWTLNWLLADQERVNFERWQEK